MQSFSMKYDRNKKLSRNYRRPIPIIIRCDRHLVCSLQPTYPLELHLFLPCVALHTVSTKPQENL